MRLSSHTNIPAPATLAMNTLALEKKQKGERVYNLTVGEPMIETPEVVIEAAEDAMRRGETHYPPVAGIPELREAASRWMRSNYQASFESKKTLVSCGGKHGLLMTLQALLEPGDEAIIIAPYWVSYPTMVNMVGGVSKIIQTRAQDGWKINPEQIEAACSGRTRVLILNNAANPTGVIYTRTEIETILSTAEKKNLIVISDEVYSGLVYDNHEYVSCSSFLQYQDRVVVIQSVSKHFAMTGWRVGLVFGPESLIGVLTNLQGQSTTGTSSISQWAAVAAFEHAEEIIPANRAILESRRNTLLEAWKKYFAKEIAVPASALYAFVPLEHFGTNEKNSVAFCFDTLEKKNVALVPGAPFGTEGYVRISFGGKEAEIEEAVKRLKI